MSFLAAQAEKANRLKMATAELFEAQQELVDFLKDEVPEHIKLKFFYRGEKPYQREMAYDNCQLLLVAENDEFCVINLTELHPDVIKEKIVKSVDYLKGGNYVCDL